MKPLTILVLSLSSMALATRGDDGNDNGSGKGGGNGQSHNSTGVSAGSQCRQLARLTELTALVANTTALEEKTKGDAAKAEALKAKAAEATKQLATLQANTTLVAECQQRAGANELDDTCRQMHQLERLEKIANNATALAEKTDGNSTKAAEIKAKAEKAVTTLADIRANATVTQFCAAKQTEEDCKDLAKLQKFVDQAGKNATATGKAAEKAAKAKERLAALQANSTLVAACAASGTTSGGSAKPSTGGSAGSSSSSVPVTVSGASGLQAFGTIVSVGLALVMGIALL